MAVTRLIAIHTNKGRNALDCLCSRINYIKNPIKTEGGNLVSSYACDSDVAAVEFALARREYLQRTGRHREDEVIAYHLRQSFKPGEITPEVANQIGYELAKRFLKGKHAFIVATHTDKPHLHNHIIFCATALDNTRKFRNFLGSGKALGKLSDQLCMEHALSVIAASQRKGMPYHKWAGGNRKFSMREQLRRAIDDALRQQPKDMSALLKLLEDAGWRVKHGAQYAFCAPQGKRYMRMDSLGDDYSETAICAVLAGEREHSPQKKRTTDTPVKPSLMIDIQAKLAQGKGRGYENWAKVFNLKQISQSMLLLNRLGITRYEELSAQIDEHLQSLEQLTAEIQAANARMAEISQQKKAIYDYLKTKDVYAAWHRSGWSQQFATEHAEPLRVHQAAKKAFDSYQGGKLPTIQALNKEYKELITKKQRWYADRRMLREKHRELLIAKANIDLLTERASSGAKTKGDNVISEFR